MVLDDSAPEIALSEVETDAEIIPLVISCLVSTPIFTFVAALIEMLLSAEVLVPITAFLSVRNRFNASDPPTELPPPEPEMASAKLRIFVMLSALMPMEPVVA